MPSQPSQGRGAVEVPEGADGGLDGIRSGDFRRNVRRHFHFRRGGGEDRGCGQRANQRCDDNAKRACDFHWRLLFVSWLVYDGQLTLSFSGRQF